MIQTYWREREKKEKKNPNNNNNNKTSSLTASRALQITANAPVSITYIQYVMIDFDPKKNNKYKKLSKNGCFNHFFYTVIYSALLSCKRQSIL